MKMNKTKTKATFVGASQQPTDEPVPGCSRNGYKKPSIMLRPCTENGLSRTEILWPRSLRCKDELKCIVSLDEERGMK